MSASFTPGPWEFRLEAVRTVIFHKAEIGEKAIAVGAGNYPDHVGNARLIAAAPDMFEALEEAAGWFEGYADEHYAKARTAPDAGEQHGREVKGKLNRERAKHLRDVLATARGDR